MSSKSAYEIRESLLVLAYDILMAKARAADGKISKEEGKNLEHVLSSPTTEEIIAEASKLNDFVSAKSK